MTREIKNYFLWMTFWHSFLYAWFSTDNWFEVNSIIAGRASFLNSKDWMHGPKPWKVGPFQVLIQMQRNSFSIKYFQSELNMAWKHMFCIVLLIRTNPILLSLDVSRDLVLERHVEFWYYFFPFFKLRFVREEEKLFSASGVKFYIQRLCLVVNR